MFLKLLTKKLLLFHNHVTGIPTLGFHGRDGVDPKEDCGNRDDCAEVWRSQDLSFDHTLEHINLNKIFHYTVIGSRGKQGAPGGDGGKGGLPGRGGLFKIVKPIGSPVDFRVIRDKGY